MQIRFCAKCGGNLESSAAFCGSCGVSVAASGINPTATGTASSAGSVQDLSETWKKRFALLEKAGGPKLPKVRELAFGERTAVVFNILAFLFGPFYYLAKGMWKKAVVLTGLGFVAIVVIDLTLNAMGVRDLTFSYFVVPALFGTRANIDYYKKMMLGKNGWF